MPSSFMVPGFISMAVEAQVLWASVIPTMLKARHLPTTSVIKHGRHTLLGVSLQGPEFMVHHSTLAGSLFTKSLSSVYGIICKWLYMQKEEVILVPVEG